MTKGELDMKTDKTSRQEHGETRKNEYFILGYDLFQKITLPPPMTRGASVGPSTTSLVSATVVKMAGAVQWQMK